MQLRQLLPPEHVFAPLDARTLREAIAAMVAGLARSGALRDAGVMERLLGQSHYRVVVPIGERAVLPHQRTEAVDELVLAVGVSPTPLDASDLDLHVAPQVVALVLAPPEASTLYLQTVSTIARLVRRDDIIDALAAARSAEEVLRIGDLSDAKIQPSLTVRDMMSHRPPVPPAAPVRDAVAIMIDLRVKALPVVGDKGEVLGIVTEWDVMRALLPQVPRGEDAQPQSLRIPGDLTVRDVMTRSVLCIAEDMGLDEVANLMLNKDVEQFPVIGEGKLVGFLSRGDIVRKLFGN
jgi:CBS domain-containing protein